MSIRNQILVALASFSGLTVICGSFTQPESEASSVRTNGWLLGSWTHRIRLTVKPDSIEGSGLLRDFPVLLKLSPAQGTVFTRANANGSDLMVTKSDGWTTLGHEIVAFDPVTKQAELWFRADSLSKAQNVFYLYYGNPAQTWFPTPGLAWNSNYLAAYHFSENPGQGVLKDWGPHANHALSAVPRANWTSSDVASGQIGQAWLFNGTSHWIDGDAISTQDSSYVISAWLKCPTNTTDFTFQANPGFWHVSAQINEMHRQPHYQDAVTGDLRWAPRPLPNDDLFHYYTWVFDGEADTILFYFDGLQQPATPHNLVPPAKHFYTGRPVNPNGGPAEGCGILGPLSWNSLDLMNGPGDEFHFSVRTHTAAWIQTEYRNQRDPAQFFVFGSEEPGGTVPVVLLEFTAMREDAHVRLTWNTAISGDDVAGFWVYRSGEGDARERITPQLLMGGPGFEWVDTHPPAGRTAYWIGALAKTGEVTFFGPRWVEPIAGVARPLAMHSSHPNPFRNITNLSWTIGVSGRTTVDVVDVRGRRVRVLFDAPMPEGTQEMQWDGKDDAGRRVPSGLYLFRVKHDSDLAVRKVLLLP